MTPLLLLILCAISYSSAQEFNICIKSDENAACQQQNISFSYTTSNLSDLPALLKYNPAHTQMLRVYLTHGNHSLATYLDFTGKNVVQIHGSSTQNTLIQCTEDIAGIHYNGKENETLLVKNLTLNCSITWNSPTALQFSRISYKLVSVTISGNKGLYAHNCYKHWMQNCSFASPVMIHHNFSQKDKEATIRIDRCTFENYPLAFALDGYKSRAEISITNSLFTRCCCDGNYYALFIRMPSNDSVSIKNTNFTNNNGGGLKILSTHVQLDSCNIANNNGIGLLIPRYERRNTSNINISHSFFPTTRRLLIFQ